LAFFDLLVEADPGNWQVYADRWLVRGRLDPDADRSADSDRAVEFGADRPFMLWAAEGEAARGAWRKAADLLARAHAGEPITMAIDYRLGPAQLLAGDEVGYRATCARLETALPSSGRIDANAANKVAMLCALGPDSVADWQTHWARMSSGVLWLWSQESK